MNEYAPTKTNLTRAQRMLRFAKSSYFLLDRKRKVLIQEMVSRIEHSKSSAKQLEVEMDQIYRLVNEANQLYGSYRVKNAAEAVPLMPSVEELSTSVMGVLVPKLFFEPYQIDLHFGLFRSGILVDDILEKIANVRERLFEFVEEENAIARLAHEIKRTTKKVNSIEKVQIPHYEQMVKNITDALEEKDREDLFRLKVVKKKLIQA